MVLASFNYEGPSPYIVAIAGVSLAICLVVITTWIRSAWLGGVLGALAGGLSANAVFLSGHGDMAGFLSLFMGGVGVVAGALAGAVCGALGRWAHRRRAPTHTAG